MSNVSTALSGAALEQLLDRLEADLEEAGSGFAADLAARLRAQPLHADSAEAIERLYNLWMRANDPQAALAVVNEDGAALLAATASADRPMLEIELAYDRLRMAAYFEQEDVLLAALKQLQGIIPRVSLQQPDYCRRMAFLDRLESGLGSLEQRLLVIELRQAFNLAVESRSAYRAFDIADYHRRRALAFSWAAQVQQAQAAAISAIASLRDAASDQNVSCEDWQWLGASLIEVVPDRLTDFQEPVRALITGGDLPRQREEEVRLARLAALAQYIQGNLDAALAACKDARYSLNADGSDDFIEFELPWLLKANRSDEAGERAFLHIYETGRAMSHGPVAIVHERLACADDNSVWWPLCLMWASDSAEMLECFMAPLGGISAGSGFSPAHAVLLANVEDADDEHSLYSVFTAARELAQRRTPNHPWIRRFSAVRDERAGQIDTATSLRQLEDVFQQDGLHDQRTQCAILSARFKIHGFTKVMQQPIPVLESGRDAYIFAAWLDEVTDETLLDSRLENWKADKDWMRAIEVRKSIYEQGIAHCERYFATGSGHPLDACAHLYSMMCNNLAIDYRYSFERYEEAISLHERGIAAYPFDEHDRGILAARIEMEDWANVVMAAEQLWHFAAGYHFSHHNPNRYVEDVTFALLKLGRHHEIPIWLERIVAWQQRQGEEDSALSDDALLARLRICVNMGEFFEHEVSVIWQQLEPQVRTSNNYLIWGGAGCVAYTRNDFALSIELFRQAIALNPCDTLFEQDGSSFMESMIANAQAQMNPKKSWWKFW